MAATYTLINSNVLSSSAASVTFSSIPATYTDLVLRISARTDNPGVNNESCYIQFNSDTATNYSYVLISGNGSAASSSIFSSQTYIGSITADSTTATANTFASWEIYVPSYLASQNKPISVIAMQENNQTAAFIRPNAGLWRNAAAITSITFTGVSGVSSFVSGSSFYLYGISNA